MKRLSVLLAAALFAGFYSVAFARVAATYNDTLKGFQTAAAEGEGVAVLIEAAGDLPGMGKFTFGREGTSVTGGNWTLTVLPPGADASASERGKLSGAVTGGTMSFNTDGTLSGASTVQLTIQAGTGEYAGVSAGSGTFNLSSSPESPTQFTGTLALDF